jgi:hypothetical protein
MSDGTSADESEACRVDDHLDEVDDGCGCTEIWEHLSEQREAAGD